MQVINEIALECGEPYILGSTAIAQQSCRFRRHTLALWWRVLGSFVGYAESGLLVWAAITEGSVKNMGLKVNDTVTVAVKATEVMVGK
jgi:hypothetical protein